MNMSIARALREKNSLSQEIDRLWEVVMSENSCLATHKRTADVKKSWETIERYTAKLVELKTKIGNANCGDHLRRMHLLDETKNRLAKLAAMNGSEDSEFSHYGEKEVKRTAVFNDTTLLAMQRQLQSEANHLQDQLDEFNATVKIDFESPLK